MLLTEMIIASKRMDIFIGNFLTFLNIKEQAGAELGQAQYKLGLDFTLISCGLGLSRLSMV